MGIAQDDQGKFPPAGGLPLPFHAKIGLQQVFKYRGVMLIKRFPPFSIIF
jgi:hypothetical protein